MLDMSQIETIRHLHNIGLTHIQIAERLGVSRPTVSKYLNQDDFSPKPPVKCVATKPSALDPFKSTIDDILESDKRRWRKQRHTAKRIFDRLVDEYGFCGSYSTVQRYVHLRRYRTDDAEYLDLVWPPASAQADFGEADFYEHGVLKRKYFLVLSFPYSNMGFVQVFSGVTAECVCQGLRDIFEFIGAVPRLIVFDNATGVGRRVGSAIREAKLFSAFRLHHGFEIRFCNPNSGHEKGNVENKVNFTRNNMFVPEVAYDDIIDYNKTLLDRCLKLATSKHYLKADAWGELFKEDRSSSLELPRRPFESVRYESYKTTKTGAVTIDGCHTYSVAPHLRECAVIVAFRAHTIDILDQNGTAVATHPRRFGSMATEDIDPVSTLRTLARKPGAWLNSRLRLDLPEKLVVHMDTLQTDMLSEYICMLKKGTEAVDYVAAVEAMATLASREKPFTQTELNLFAKRIATYGLKGIPDPGPDLTYYDECLLKRGA